MYIKTYIACKNNLNLIKKLLKTISFYLFILFILKILYINIYELYINKASYTDLLILRLSHSFLHSMFKKKVRVYCSRWVQSLNNILYRVQFGENVPMSCDK